MLTYYNFQMEDLSRFDTTAPSYDLNGKRQMLCAPEKRIPSF